MPPKSKPKNNLKTKKQLGWNCFDIATNIERDQLVKFALQNAKSLAFRSLLAPEIRHAAMVTAILMNQKDSDQEELNLKLATLFSLAETTDIDSNTLHHTANEAIEKSEKITFDAFALPKEMRTPELQALANRYLEAHDKMQPYVTACNADQLLTLGKTLSITELDELKNNKLKKHDFFYYTDSYSNYLKKRAEILTPVEQEFIAYSQSEKIYIQYIQHYYAKNGWVAFQRQFQGERSTSMLDIAARMLQAKIIVMQPSDNGLQKIYETDNFAEKLPATIVFNGHSHFSSYKEYLETEAENSSSETEQDEDSDEASSTAASTTNKPKTNAATITAEQLEKKIKAIIQFFNSLKKQNEKKPQQLKNQLDEVNFYFSRPNLVHGASNYGGLQTLKNKYSARLFRISLYINYAISLTEQEANTASKGFTLLAQRYKIKRAYTELLKGKKFQKAGFGDFNHEHPATQPNPIQKQSKKNIIRLIAVLKKLNGNSNNRFGLRDDEIELFGSLLNLPLRLQHATNYFYPIQNVGSLDSYTEIQRRDSNYESPFSTKGNINKLGNGGFVFFRVFVDPINGKETRYGNTSLVFDLNILQKCGWISLHDQLNPFPSKNTKHFYWDNRLLRTSEIAARKSNSSDKGLLDGLCYQYRQEKITKYNGTKDSLKSFGVKIETKKITRSFLREIFYGEDILLGIALSVIRELRYFEKSGFRAVFISKFHKASEDQKQVLLGEFIKELFRIEGKYPVAVRMEANLNAKALFFTPLAQTDKLKKHDRKITVINPEGDGRYNIDISENDEAFKLANLRDRVKYVTERISVARRQRARFKDNENKQDNFEQWDTELTELTKEHKKITQQLNNDQINRQELIDYFVEECIVEGAIFEKIDTFKLNLIKIFYDDLIFNDIVTLEELLDTPTQILSLLSEERFNELLLDEEVDFDEFTACSPQQLEILSQYEIEKPIHEIGYTVKELLELYNENPMHLVCLTCDNLTDLVLDEAPNVDPVIMQYADEEDVDLEWVMEQLSESEQMTFRINLGLKDDPISDDENEASSSEELSEQESSDLDTNSQTEDYDDEIPITSYESPNPKR